LLLIDQSRSMDEPFFGAFGQSKASAVADAVNRLLQNLVLRSAKGDGVRDYFRIGVIGYGKTIKAGLGGSLPFDILLPTGRASAPPLGVERRTKLVPGGAGGTVEQTVKFPVWCAREANGQTPMGGAVAAAARGVKGFAEQSPASSPPIVMNLTDGVPSD